MRYEIGWHSSDEGSCHVALIDDEGERDELFDVQLYDPEVVEDDGRTAREVSLAALERLIDHANTGAAEPTHHSTGDPLGLGDDDDDAPAKGD